MVKLDNIKNIIFDFGGVIINIDFYLTYNAFISLGINNLDQLFSQAKQTNIFDDFEKGITSPDVFRTQLKDFLSFKISNDDFDRAWNKMILDIPPARISLLKNLKSKYNTFLLSNSNQIHYDFYLGNLQKEFGVNKFDDLFEKAYFSFDIGMIKPNSDIFNFVISENNLNPKETLFIDDSIQHIEAAKKLGLQTYFIEKETITDVLNYKE